MKVIERVIQSAGEPGKNDLWLKEEGNSLSLKAHHNGDWRTVAGGGDVPAGGGADWSVNDPSAPGYIANRPFYEESGIDEIKDARVYLDQNAGALQDYNNFLYVLGNERYYFTFTQTEQSDTPTWKLQSADGDYFFVIDSTTQVITVSNSETGYLRTFTSESFVPASADSDTYVVLGTDINMMGTIVHQIDDKFLPKDEHDNQFIPIKVVRGHLNGKHFMQNNDEISLGEAISFIINSGGVIAFNVSEGNESVMGYSVGVSNGIITFTDGYTWGGVF